jgi:hypothetical protein
MDTAEEERRECQQYAILASLLLRSPVIAASTQYRSFYIGPAQSFCQVTKPDFRAEFRQLVDSWRQDTRYLSSAVAASMHPAYLKIIGKGPVVLPYLLEEMRERPDHWFIALNAISNEDPVREGASFREAVADWITWGSVRGYLP